MSEVKVFFKLQQDEDGYPEVGTESVWAQPTDDPGEYILDNIPFFARDATTGDTIKVRIEEGVLWFESLQRSSGNSLIRVVFFELERKDDVANTLSTMGCDSEFLKSSGLIAINIPSNISLTNVQSYLRSESERGVLDFEEAILRQ